MTLHVCTKPVTTMPNNALDAIYEYLGNTRTCMTIEKLIMSGKMESRLLNN